MGSRTLLHLIIVLFLFVLCPCAPTPRIDTSPFAADPTGLLASIAEDRDHITSFRGVGRLDLIMRDKGQSTRVAWIGSRPCRFRVETLGVWGQRGYTFLVAGGRSYLHFHGEGECFEGKATARNLSRLVSVPLTAEDILVLLSGQIPIVSFDDVQLRYSEEEGRWCLHLYRRGTQLVERLWLDEWGERIEAVEVFERSGRLNYRATFDQVTDIEGIPVAQRIHASDDAGAAVSLHMEKLWIGVDAPTDAYTPPFPCSE